MEKNELKKKLRARIAKTGGPLSAGIVRPRKIKKGMTVEQRRFSFAAGRWDQPLPSELDSPNTLVLVFGSPRADEQNGLLEVAHSFPNSVVVGCSGAGEISGTQVLDEAISVSIARFARTELRLASTTVQSADESKTAGQKIAKELLRDDLGAIFVLSEGLNVNGTELIRGVNSVVPEDVVVTGGLAGDGADFTRTWVLVGKQAATNTVAAVGFYGDDLEVTHGSKGGWDPFGPQRKVTRSEGNVLFELDGKPALALYKTYLGDLANELPASGLRFPLALVGGDGEEERNVVRTLLSVDHEAQSLTFAGDIPQGQRVQLMKAQFERLVDGADEAATEASHGQSSDGLAVAVSCVGRRLVMGDRTEDELEAVKQRLSAATALTGFYSYGELSPVGGGRCDLHNQTMTLTVFGERSGSDHERTLPRPKPSIPAPSVDGMATEQRIYSMKSRSWDAPLPEVDSSRTLVLAFGSPSLRDDPSPLHELSKRYPAARIVGCSGSGEILGTHVQDDSLCVTATRFRKTDVALAYTEVSQPEDSYDAGVRIAKQLRKPGLRAVFIISEGLSINGTDLVRGVNSSVDESVVVTGGLAGDGTAFENTWVYVDGQVRGKTVAAVGFYGDALRVSHGSQGGWDSFGPRREVTRSEGNVLYELDGKPALALYKTYLGDKAADLPASGLLFPLALTGGGSEDRNVVRTLLDVDHEQQSLTFAGDIPQGSSVQLMKAHFDRLIDGADSAASMAALDVHDSNSLAIAVSCVGRRLVLGERTEDELEAVAARLGDDTAITGFYSYGELSPVANGRCDLHNQTMTLTVFSEDETVSNEATILPPRLEEREVEVSQSVWQMRSGEWTDQLPEIDSSRTLVLAFGAPALRTNRAVFEELAAKYPNSRIVGCSGSGEISGTQVLDESLSVTATRFHHTDLELTWTSVDAPDASFEAGQKIAQNLSKSGLRAVFILSEGLKINGTDLVRGVNSVVSDDVVVTGGLAGDGTAFEDTWVYVDGQVRSQVVAAVGFYGDRLQVAHGSQGGWDSFGPERTVTRSEGNVLYELDGKPALALYKTYLGDKAADLPASGLLFPLSLLGGDDGNRNVVRTLLDVNHDDQSLTFAGDIPQGARVQLMKAHFDRLVDGADIAASMARLEASDSNSLAIAVSCVGRRLVLGDRTEDELEAVAERLGPKSRITGFYSYGELSPVADGSCDLHNQTMTLTVFGESMTEDIDPLTPVDFDKTAMVSQQPIFTTTSYIYSLDKGDWNRHPSPALDSDKTLITAFGSPRIWDEGDVFSDLRARFPKATIVGCSGAGEIAGNNVVDDSLSVAVARFNKTTLATAFRPVESPEDSHRVGEEVARELASQGSLRAVFLISEGLGVNGTDLVRGVNEVVGEGVVVTGGLAGDGTRFEKTWVYAADELHSKGVVAVGFYGPYLRVSHGSQGGWDNFGPERSVTRSEGNVVYELDGRPALALYKTYLGDKADELPASGLLFPLALLGDGNDDRNVVRTLLSVDHEQQSLTFAGDVPQGARVQLMKAHFDKLVDAADEAAGIASVEDMNENALAIAVSCVGRRLVLGDRTEDELEAIMSRLGPATTLTGFYSYGELSPVAGGSCDLHNQTMTLTLFGESSTPVTTAKKPKSAPPVPRAKASKPPTPSLPKPTPASDGPSTPPISKPAVTEPPKKERAQTTPPRAPSNRSSQILPAASPEFSTADNWERPTIPIRSHAPRGGAMEVGVSERDGIMTVTLTGKMDEKFNGAELGRKLKGLVLFDLAGVHRVTSFGVREWLTMLKETSGVDGMYLSRCSEGISNQLSTIKAFAGDASVVSFFAPYRCEHCSTSFNAMIDTEFDNVSLSKNVPPEVGCPRCAMETRGLDEDPLTFFAFARTAPEVPGFIRKRIEVLDPIGQVDPVEKQILPDATSIRVNVEVDDSIRWRRLLDGVEGRVVVDFMGGTTATPSGARRFVAAARAHLDEANFELFDVPWEVLRALAEADLAVQVKSGLVEVATDAGKEEVKVDFAASARRIEQGKDPDIASPNPPASADFSAALDILAYAAGVEVATETEAPAPTPAAAPEPVAAPAAEPEPAIATPRAGMSPVQGAVIGVLVTVLIGVVAYKTVGEDMLGLNSAPAASATNAAADDKSATIAAGANPSKAEAKAGEPDDKSGEESGATAEEAPQGNAIGQWDTESGVVPGWADTPLLVDENAVRLVGRGEAKTKDAAVQSSRDAAVLALVEYLKTELRGEPIYELASSSAAATPDQVIATFTRQMGPSFVLKRTQQSFKTVEGGFESAVQYEVARTSVDGALSKYRGILETPSADFGVRFPTLKGPKDHDVVVVRSKTAEVLPGDVVLSEDAEAIYDLEALSTIAETEGRISLVVDSNGTAKPARLLTK